MELSKEQVASSLRSFKSRRDSLLHEDSAFDHHLSRFLEICRNDQLVKSVLDPLLTTINVNAEQWWEKAGERDEKLVFPSDADSEMVLRYRILERLEANDGLILRIARAHWKTKRSEGEELFRTIVVRPLADELTHRLGEAADLATPEARALQAVPLNRIPSPRERKIFLSHKSADKTLVRRYYNALKELGFSPWLDEPEMAVGANLEREIFRGLEESCAAVFFITENFKDENYLASEIDYAVGQKRKKGRKFAIITLRYPPANKIPNLLTPYIFKDVNNDLEGFYELLRGLPLEFGDPRWKIDVVI